MKRYAVYMRVSSDKQDVASQRHAITAWLAARGITDPVWYEETASGKRDDRPEFQRLCLDVRAGQIAGVVVFRLDRISRRAVTAMQTLLEWLTLGVEFFAVDQPILHLGTDNPMRLTIAAMFSEFAQIEREAIVARVRAGLRAAAARGKRLGAAPKVTAAQVADILRRHQAGDTERAIAAQVGVPRSTVGRHIRANVKANHGSR